jgi:ferritin-like protein
MEEPVSAEKQKLIDDLVKSAFEGISKYCFVETVEYDRLGRLEDNIKKAINEQNELKKYFNNGSDYEILELLESLLK